MKHELAERPQQQLAAVSAGSRGVTFGTLAEMKDFALSVVNSGLAPRDFKSPEAVLIAMQLGMEVGLNPMQALQSIAVINGRPVIYGDGALALVKAHPECDDVIETFERGDGDDNMRAVCEVHRRNQVPVVRTFSVAQAKKAGLWGKGGPWSQYPQRMLQMRARGFAIRDAFPDALKGIRMAEEVQDITQRPVEGRVTSTKLILPGDEEPAPLTLGEGASATDAPKLDPVNGAGEFTWEAADQ